MSAKSIKLCLSIRSYIGFHPLARHFYGTLVEYDDFDAPKITVTHVLTGEEAKAINDLDSHDTYKAGDATERFTTRENLIEHALLAARDAYGDKVRVYLGNRASALENLKLLSG